MDLWRAGLTPAPKNPASVPPRDTGDTSEQLQNDLEPARSDDLQSLGLIPALRAPGWKPRGRADPELGEQRQK